MQWKEKEMAMGSSLRRLGCHIGLEKKLRKKERNVLMPCTLSNIVFYATGALRIWRELNEQLVASSGSHLFQGPSHLSQVLVK
jgi:hypothetical protein